MKINSQDLKFIQENSLDGGFLQSDEWRKFQGSVGRRTFYVASDNFQANIVEHKLPIVGRYFYIPRGPIFCHPELGSGSNKKLDSGTETGMTEVINLAKRNNAGWIRFDANNANMLGIVRENWRVAKAPHDMQPREIFLVDITKPEEQLLAEMKSKTRYNIKLSQKRGVSVKVISNFQIPRLLKPGTGGQAISNQIPNPNDQISKKYVEKFIELIKITAQRDKIIPHPDVYYHKMFETIPADNLKLYIAEFEGKIIAANIVVFYGKFATYLHGASDNEYRNVMAPYLLQWQAILDAKEAGCNFYDLGGVKIPRPGTRNPEHTGWEGITKFKTGFSVTTEPTIFPGSYDIVINPFRYNIYKILQRIKSYF